MSRTSYRGAQFFVVTAELLQGEVGPDGESHWMEGVMLSAVYLMLALSFYHLPGQ